MVAAGGPCSGLLAAMVSVVAVCVLLGGYVRLMDERMFIASESVEDLTVAEARVKPSRWAGAVLDVLRDYRLVSSARRSIAAVLASCRELRRLTDDEALALHLGARVQDPSCVVELEPLRWERAGDDADADALTASAVEGVDDTPAAGNGANTSCSSGRCRHRRQALLFPVFAARLLSVRVTTPSIS